MTHYDFIALEPSPELHKRSEKLAEFYEFSYQAFEDFDGLALADTEISCRFALVCTDKNASRNEAFGITQIVRQVVPQAFITVVLHGRLAAEDNQFVKKSGGDLVMMEQEVTETCKLEFFASQKIHAAMFPVKSYEFKQGSKTDFKVLHFMPLNQKFLPVLQPGQEIDERKLKKLNEVGELYVRREDIGAYQTYLEANSDQSAEGLTSRCRAQYLKLLVAYSDLVINITDQSENISFEKGKELFQQCELIANQLVVALGSTVDPWSVVNNSAHKEFGSLERMPAVAAYGGIISLVTGFSTPSEVVLTALLSDVGLLYMSPTTAAKLREGRQSEMHAEELVEYHKHPLMSLNRALTAKLQVPESLKKAILCTHEQPDRKGFPEKIAAEMIPLASQMVQFSELLDFRSKTRMGAERRNPRDVALEIIKEETARPGRITPTLLTALKVYFGKPT